MVHLLSIDETNWREPLRVRPEQEHCVASSTVLLARAYAYRNLHSRAFYVCDEGKIVGMGLYHDCPELGSYDLSQLFIDARFQRRGYGRQAARIALEEMRRDARWPKVVLCYIEGNEAARHLYESLGFVETDRDGDEIILERVL